MTDLQEFARLFITNAVMPNKNEFTGRVLVTDLSSSTIVFCQGYFMCEQYHLFPNKTCPSHSHPFSSLTVYQGGTLQGARSNGKLYTYVDSDINFIPNELAPGDEHSFIVGHQGARVLVFSQWQDLAQRDSAVIKYDGVSMGPLHDEIKELNGVE